MSGVSCQRSEMTAQPTNQHHHAWKSSPVATHKSRGAQHSTRTPTPSPSGPCRLTNRRLAIDNWMGWTTWWLSRGACTRSHPELGRENPQRPWYCVLRHGRVGRRQVFQPIQNRKTPTTKSWGNHPASTPREYPTRQANNRRPENRPNNKICYLQPRGGAAR